MRVLIFPASLALGGSQLNAIELAGAVRDRGHDVWVFGPPGPLTDTVDTLGLPFLPAPARPKVRPSPHVMLELTKAVRRHSIDLVHGFEWPPILEAAYGPSTVLGTAVVGTILSMGIAPFVPEYLPLIVGSEHIAQAERQHRPDVSLIEPPVDTHLNQPWNDPAAIASARADLGAAPGDFLLVVVSRLADELKRDGILEAIRAAAMLAGELPLHIAIVGDGPARPIVEAAVAQANSAAGRAVVTMTGSWSDPRPAYAAADVTFGMGSSALRAMSFAKPLIVQGERGFWQLLTPESLPTFLYQGFYGVGDGGDGSPLFADIVRSLYRDQATFARLGEFGREVVESRFSLDGAAKTQEEIYHRALADKPGRARVVPRLVRPGTQVIGYEFNRRWTRWRGTRAMDDFNAINKQPPFPAKIPSPAIQATQGASTDVR